MILQIRSPSRLSALLLLLFTASTACAASAGPATLPPAWPASTAPPVVLAADPVRPLLLGGLRVTLDASTLADTRDAIGAGVRQQHGQGTESLDWLCYTLSDAAPAQRLWLTASELSRGRIDAVIAAEVAGGAGATPQCPELPAKFRPVRFDDGLWLGGTSAELRKALGVPAKAGPHFASLFQGQAGSLQVMSSTAIEFRGARVVQLHVAHSSAN